MTVPDFSHERQALGSGFTRVAGVDEVGRGPLAGPVTAAAVVLNANAIPPGLNDSKKLSPRRRDSLCALILETAAVGIGHASVEEIEQFNILGASHLAMRRAVAALPEPPDRLLIDGNRMPPGLPCSAMTIVQGDTLCLSIAAASIIAKVERDRIMVDLAQQHPGYGWEHNAGYPTPDHLAALKKQGVSAAHRRTFRPVHKILYQEFL